MAIQMSDNSPAGLHAVDAYHRVEEVSIKTKHMLFYTVRSYQSSDSVTPFKESKHRTTYDLNGENPIQQAYSHLKTVEYYKGSVDC